MSDPIAIVDAETLASSLGAPHTAASVGQIVDWTNALVTDEWTNPVDPVPWRITMLAYEVASRPLRNPKGLQSWTVSLDDAARTERLPDYLARAGLYLTDDELKVLRGLATQPRRRFRNIRLTPGH